MIFPSLTVITLTGHTFIHIPHKLHFVLSTTYPPNLFLKIALFGQTFSHLPQVIQLTAFPLTTLIASVGQASTQFPEPLQLPVVINISYYPT